MTPHLRCLRNTPAALENLCALATPENLRFKPSPERWSICEVLNHLTEVETRVTGSRARRILEEEMPLFVDYDRDARYAEGAYKNDDGELALENFQKARAASLRWLEEIRPSDWKRRGRHHVVGGFPMYFAITSISNVLIAFANNMHKHGCEKQSR